MKTSARLCENPDKHEKTRKNTKTAKTQYINRRKSTKIHENHKITEIHLKKHPGPAKVQKKVYLWYIERKCPANGRKCFNLAQMAQTDQRYRNQWKSIGWIWFWHLQAISLPTHD